jgi:hypothetical protein
MILAANLRIRIVRELWWGEGGKAAHWDLGLRAGQRA